MKTSPALRGPARCQALPKGWGSGVLQELPTWPLGPEALGGNTSFHLERFLGQEEVKGEGVADSDFQSSQWQEDWRTLGQVTGVPGSVSTRSGDSRV